MALELLQQGQAVEVSLLGSGQGDSPVGSPEWWRDTLEAEMVRRSSLLALYEDYYTGRHKLTFASAQFRDAFGLMLSAISDNWIPLVIGAAVERLQPQGFRFGANREGDADAWDIWQRNDLDTDAQLGFTEACKHGESYLLVWPEQQTTGVFGRFFSRSSLDADVRITLEHPSQMIVAREAGDRRRIAAAFKRWIEPTGTIMGTLYLPDRTYRYQREERGAWQPRGAQSESPNRLGVVPVVPLVNDPQMMGAYPPASILAAPHSVPNVPVGLGRSDMADVISTVDQINKLLCDMLVASEVSAFRQRWVTGLEVPIDPDTGEAMEPFKAAVDRLWVAPPDEDGNASARFGEFSTTDLSNYHKAIETRIQSLAARTRTPPHYLLGSIVNASGDALKASETGLASKVNGKARHFGEALERAVRLAFAWQNDDRAKDPSAETVWGPTESRSESEYVDSLVKKMALGVPKEQLWADAGYSPQQIARFKSMLVDEQVLSALIQPQQPEPQQVPAGVVPAA